MENGAEGSKTKWATAGAQAVWQTAHPPLPTLPGALHASCEGHTMRDLLHIENMHCSTDPSQYNFYAPKIQP